MPVKLAKLLGTKMGNIKSKSKIKGNRSEHNRLQGSNHKYYSQDDDVPLDFIEEDPEVSRLRKNIRSNPEGFILNNLMMCVEFLKNYDEEMVEMRETLVSPRETAINNRLLPEKRVLLPDVLQERIACNVTFTSRRETVDPTVEPLQPVRMFVVYDNIEVSDQYDTAQYSSMRDTITYNMRIRPSKHKGYVHLQRMETTPSTRNPVSGEEVDLSSIAEDGDGFYSDGVSLYDHAQLRPLSPQNSSTLDSMKLTKSKSMPELLDDETPATQFNERLSASRNKLPLMSSNDYKADTGYSSMSESTSIKSQSTISKQDLEGQRRNITRNNRQFPALKNRTTCASSASSTSSGYKSGNYDSDSELGYSTKSLGKLKPLNPTEMPKSCFCQVTYTSDNRIYDPIEDSKKHIISSKERRVQVERNRRNYDVWYLNSTRFRKRFYKVFLESLALPLDLEEAIIRYRRPYYYGSVIYCDKVEVSTTAKCNISESYEVIPCVWTHWPECANEWLERFRNSWPGPEMIRHISKFGCYIIPQEFETKEDNSNNTEWQLTFPAAERYLETCMNHAQMRVYIIVMMLHKTFIRAVESAPDRLNTHQIRNQLFWLMEKTPSEWVENRTGDYLVKLLNCLCYCINQDEAFLKDYFLQEKNLFKNSEKGSLFFSLKQLKRILENPVMYVLHAMENIRYKSKFFPRLNYEELLRILTAEELLLINPNLEKKATSSALMRDQLEDDEAYIDRRGFWDDAKKKKDQYSNFSKRPVTNRTLINPSRAHDSVVDIAIRCGELKGIRLSKLLDFFIEHLIKMAKQYQEYGALQQKNEYLNHAMSLSILLAEDEMFKDEARHHLREISIIRKQVNHSRSQDTPPETPKRNAEKPNFSLATSSVPVSNHGASANYQVELSESTKKTSDSSVFSCPWKERYSTTSNQSLTPLPGTSETSSQNSSKSLPVLDERKKSDVIYNDTSCISMTKLDVNEKIGELEEAKEKDFSKAENTEKTKKDSGESGVIALKEEDEASHNDTYI